MLSLLIVRCSRHSVNATLPYINLQRPRTNRLHTLGASCPTAKTCQIQTGSSLPRAVRPHSRIRPKSLRWRAPLGGTTGHSTVPVRAGGVQAEKRRWSIFAAFSVVLAQRSLHYDLAPWLAYPSALCTLHLAPATASPQRKRSKACLSVLSVICLDTYCTVGRCLSVSLSAADRHHQSRVYMHTYLHTHTYTSTENRYITHSPLPGSVNTAAV